MDKPTRGEMTTDVTVLLTNDQIATLDEISAAIRRDLTPLQSLTSCIH